MVLNWEGLTYTQNGKLELGDFFLLSCFCIFVPPCNIAKANHYLSTFQIRFKLADFAHNKVLTKI